jgi:aryl-alcohol dehydrogenase-like predicted oxidoreductase
VGCNYTSNYKVSDLISRTLKDIDHFGLDRINCILFHRPSIKKIYSDKKFFQFIRKNYPHLPIGISTNSLEIYRAYKDQMDIGIVQLALNLLDYNSNELLLNTLQNDNISLQIRSVLSSGLLTGKYNEDSIFTDNMRKRYHEDKNSFNYLKRMKTSHEIINYLNETYNIRIKDIPNFLYSLFEELSNVQCVIRGGSTLNQITENKKSFIVNNRVKEDIFLKMKYEWNCNYV